MRRIAVIHDWLVTYGGAEHVLAEILDCYPEADLFSLVDFLPNPQRGFLNGRKVKTSILQRFPFARSRYRSYLPIMPWLIKQFDLKGYDLVISSSHAVSKGVRLSHDQLHVCLCYTPIRYAWGLRDSYLKDAGLDSGLTGFLARYVLERIRIWDQNAAKSVAHFIAISRCIHNRIKHAYSRDSLVIYPPVDVDRFALKVSKSDFYMSASRLVPYKKMAMIIEAFNEMPERRLFVFGDGPEANRCRALAGPNVTMMGYQPDDILIDYMQRARAFVFAAEEDFGIVPIEAQACGTPVIAFDKGALQETIFGLDSMMPTGVFFEQQTAGALIEAVIKFERTCHLISAEACRQNAIRFSVDRFRKTFVDYIEDCWSESKGSGLN